MHTPFFMHFNVSNALNLFFASISRSLFLGLYVMGLACFARRLVYCCFCQTPDWFERGSKMHSSIDKFLAHTLRGVSCGVTLSVSISTAIRDDNF